MRPRRMGLGWGDGTSRPFFCRNSALFGRRLSVTPSSPLVVLVSSVDFANLASPKVRSFRETRTVWLRSKEPAPLSW